MKVRIYQRTKNAMQSGRWTSREWILEHEPETRRYPEPLMGWTASGDTLNQVTLIFKTQAEAEEFAAGKGWEAAVTPPHERHVKPRNYIDNFKYKPPQSKEA